jgi:hypothetical protein
VAQARTTIVNKAIHYQSKEVTESVRSLSMDRAGKHFQSLFQVLSFLALVGEVDQMLEEQASVHLVRLIEEGRRKHTNPGALDFLTALKEFLGEPSQSPLLKEWYPLEQVAAYLRNSYEVLDTVNAKTLSQELNKWPDLIRERKRIAVRDANGTKQVTCVMFNQVALNNHLY